MKYLALLLIFGFGISGSLGQTIKSLGYNTTNGQVVYSGTNTLTFTNAVSFGGDYKIDEGQLSYGGTTFFESETQTWFFPFNFENATIAATTRANLGFSTNLNTLWTATDSASARQAIMVSFPIAVTNGGSGATTGAGALTNFGVFAANSGLFITTATNVYPNFATVIGVGATNADGGAGNTVLGQGAAGSVDSTDLGGVAVGRGSFTGSDGTAVGNGARASGTIGIALGVRAVATNGVQIGVGTNSTSSTIQFRSAGLIDTNEWGALANASTLGRFAMTNTSAELFRNEIGLGATNAPTFSNLTINGNLTNNGTIYGLKTNVGPFEGIGNFFASNNTTVGNETLFRVGIAETTNKSAQFGFRVARTNNGGEGLAVFSVFGYNALMMIGPSDRSRSNSLTNTNAAIEADIWTMSESNRVMTLRDTNTGATVMHRPIGFNTNEVSTTAPANTTVTNPTGWIQIYVGTNSVRVPYYQ